MQRTTSHVCPMADVTWERERMNGNGWVNTSNRVSIKTNEIVMQFVFVGYKAREVQAVNYPNP